MTLIADILIGVFSLIFLILFVVFGIRLINAVIRWLNRH